MINDKKLIVVMPAYNAEETLAQTYAEIPHDIVDDVILVDDASDDKTVEEAGKLGISHIITHKKNVGYGGNQKSCYQKALSLNADIIIMVHPDYQYTPRLIRALASLIAEDVYDCVLASRILGRGAVRGGMPIYKYIANRLLSLIQNVVTGQKISEYHTGYRAYSKSIFESIPIENNSNDFIFDNQFLLQIIFSGYRIGEVSCPTRYVAESSSISGIPMLRYGYSVLVETSLFAMAKIGFKQSKYNKGVDS